MYVIVSRRTEGIKYIYIENKVVFCFVDSNINVIYILIGIIINQCNLSDFHMVLNFYLFMQYAMDKSFNNRLT